MKSKERQAYIINAARVAISDGRELESSGRICKAIEKHATLNDLEQSNFEAMLDTPGIWSTDYYEKENGNAKMVQNMRAKKKAFMSACQKLRFRQRTMARRKKNIGKGAPLSLGGKNELRSEI